MKRNLLYFFLSWVMILSLTGCEDRVDIILTETSFTEVSIPSIIESVPEESSENMSVITNAEITEAISQTTTEVTTRPENIEEALERYERRGLDTSFEPIKETETTVFAKKYVREMLEAVDCIADTAWNTVIDLDEYIDDGYLKDYILFELKIYGRNITGVRNNYEIEYLEAVEQKTSG